MGTLILAVTTLLLYSIGTALQALDFRRRVDAHPTLTKTIGLLALASHGALLALTVQAQEGYNFSFFHSAAIISWFIVALLLILSLRRPMFSLFLGIYPLAALTIISLLVFHSPPRYISQDNWGMLSHISLSITAYSLFTLAAAQALLLHLQNRQLKHNYNSLLVRNLPPLQTMESVLFELIWAGVIVLTLAIITGALFVDDLFVKSLAHKTAFSLIALAVFAALLAGRYAFGWRGRTATRWTLIGCALLMIGYFGSKLVLELIIQRAG